MLRVERITIGYDSRRSAPHLLQVYQEIDGQKLIDYIKQYGELEEWEKDYVMWAHRIDQNVSDWEQKVVNGDAKESKEGLREEEMLKGVIQESTPKGVQ